jgi:hypothetical protein
VPGGLAADETERMPDEVTCRTVQSAVDPNAVNQKEKADASGASIFPLPRIHSALIIILTSLTPNLWRHSTNHGNP